MSAIFASYFYPAPPVQSRRPESDANSEGVLEPNNVQRTLSRKRKAEGSMRKKSSTQNRKVESKLPISVRSFEAKVIEVFRGIWGNGNFSLTSDVKSRLLQRYDRIPNDWKSSYHLGESLSIPERLQKAIIGVISEEMLFKTPKDMKTYLQKTDAIQQSYREHCDDIIRTILEVIPTVNQPSISG